MDRMLLVRTRESSKASFSYPAYPVYPVKEEEYG